MAAKSIYKKDGTLTRHRGQFNPEHPGPYELSRSKVENFIKCEACFWLERVKYVDFPSIPSFNINTNTDRLLKRDMDSVRGKSSHPVLEKFNLGHLTPFEHEDLERWTQSTQFGGSPNHFNTIHEETNILFGGGLDDVYYNNDTGELHIVDYKSTSSQKEDPEKVNLDGKWKGSFKRQMDMYVWTMRRRGFETSDIGYFVYVDGLHKGIDGMLLDEFSTHYPPSESPLYEEHGVMFFGLDIIPYEVDTGWIDPTLEKIKQCLYKKKCPEHSKTCEHGIFLDQVNIAVQ